MCLVWFEVLRLQLSRHRQAEARRKVIRNLRLMWRLKIVKKALRRKALGDPEALRAKLLNQLEVCHASNLLLGQRATPRSTPQARIATKHNL